MAKKRLKKINKKVIEKRAISKGDRVWAFLSVLFLILGFFITLLLRRDDKYVMHYAKQGLIIFTLFVILTLISYIPIVGNYIFWVGFVVITIIWLICIVNSLSGKMINTPLINLILKSI